MCDCICSGEVYGVPGQVVGTQDDVRNQLSLFAHHSTKDMLTHYYF